MTQTYQGLLHDIEIGLKAAMEYRLDEVRDTISPQAIEAVQRFIMEMADADRNRNERLH